MTPISNTILPSKKTNIIVKANSGIVNCNIIDSFIDLAVKDSLNSNRRISLSDDYELVSTKTRKYGYYYDIVVINRYTNDIVILLQYNKIFLFNCPDDIWLLFKAILETTTDSNYVYTGLPQEYVEETRFSLSKLQNNEIATYIVQTLMNDGILKVAQ
jgi:hypothetical protein